MVLSYVYYRRKYERNEKLGSHIWLTKAEKSAGLSSEEPIVKTPFSRSSTLSRVGRHSFLLKSGRRYKNQKHLRNESDASEMTVEMAAKCQTQNKENESPPSSSPTSESVRSENLSNGGQSDNNFTLNRSENASKYDTLNTSISQQIKANRNRAIVQRPSKLIKRGFVPEILKTESFNSTHEKTVYRQVSGRQSTRRLLSDTDEMPEQKV